MSRKKGRTCPVCFTHYDGERRTCTEVCAERWSAWSGEKRAQRLEEVEDRERSARYQLGTTRDAQEVEPERPTMELVERWFTLAARV